MESIHGRMFVTCVGRGLFILGLRKPGDVGVSLRFAWLLNLAKCSPTSAGLGLLTKTKNTADLTHITMLSAPIFSIPRNASKMANYLLGRRKG